MDEILKYFKIDETYTKPIRKPKLFTKVKDQIPLIEDYNYSADLIEMPTTKQGFKYLFTITDLSNDDFDLEPLKTKQPKETLQALKRIFKRKYLKMPFSSIQSDNGNEFKGEFHKFLYDNNILHKKSLPYRHTQQSNIEALNKQLVRLFNGYMNAVEEETGETYNNWTDIIDDVRKLLNKYIRKKLPKNIYKYEYPLFNPTKEPKYKVGDLVYHQLDYPKNALLDKQPTANLRVGDYRWNKIPKKIEKVLY
jgi:hypothetical protein